MVTVYNLNPILTEHAYAVSSDILVPKVGSYNIEDVFRYPTFNGRYTTVIAPIESNVELEFCNSRYDFDEVSISLPEESPCDYSKKLWIHPNCTISRTQVAKKYTLVRKPSAADLCVFPKRSFDTYKVCKHVIFLNEQKGKVYLIKEEKQYNANDGFYTPIVPIEEYKEGISILDINPYLKNMSLSTKLSRGCYWGEKDTFTEDNWKDFLNAKLYYSGSCFVLDKKDAFVIDIVSNNFLNIVFEDTVMKSLGSTENKLDKEVYDSIYGMLTSSDSEIVGMGLKTLAELDYSKYYNSVIHLLCSTGNWRDSGMKHSTTVKFMLDTLDQYRYSREHYSDTIDKDDYELMKDVVITDINNSVNNIISNYKHRFPFVTLNINTDISITPDLKEDNNESDSEETN